MTTVTTTEFQLLEKQILELGRFVENSISHAITSLKHRDELLARSVVEDDKKIDQAELEVQARCLSILEELEPKGHELRYVVAILKINDSLERIGDLSENIADTVIAVGNWERFQQVGGIGDLARKAEKMVRESLKALATRDPDMARSVIEYDDQVDWAQDRIREKIELELDRIPENASPLLRLENVTRQFERMGDIACNIAEEVIFIVEDQVIRHR